MTASAPAAASAHVHAGNVLHAVLSDASHREYFDERAIAEPNRFATIS